MKTYLHIGTEKTATTSIQHFLSNNKELLSQLGYIFPNDKGSNHTYLATASAESFDKVKDLLIYQNIEKNTTQKGFYKEVKEYLMSLCEQQNSESKKLILSNEHCSSRLTTLQEIKQLKDLLSAVATQTKVIIYLRKQDDYITSLYSTYIKIGGTETFQNFLKYKEKEYRYNYEKILGLWTEVFGTENIIIRLYEKESFFEGNIVLDFLKIIGIHKHSKFIFQSSKNKSMDTKSLEFLRNLNFHMPHFINQKVNNERAKIIDLLEQIPSTDIPITDSSLLQQFYHNFSKSNTKVAEKYLGTSFLFEHKESSDIRKPESQNEIQDFFYLFSELWKLNTKE
ncbi:MAG: hypothetical protein GQ527_08970 [Bacteroidales bacterium]|nr:hypothetical protein [Bacteroidales bacterium]